MEVVTDTRPTTIGAVETSVEVFQSQQSQQSQSQVILHLPHATFGSDVATSATLLPPAPIGDDAMGLMQAVTVSSDDASLRGATPLRVMDGFEAAWPRSTVHACWWCCHQFDGIPVGLPLRHVAGVFHCTGVFCGLECALAYNRRERHGHDADDTANHIQLMAMRMVPGHAFRGVRAAPDRCLLRLFGGPLSIEEFRAVTAPGSERDLRLHLPPVQAVVAAVEEISTAAAGSTRRTDQRIPLDLARIRRAGERTSTMGGSSRNGRASKNTLEAAMPNLRIS